MSSSRMPVGQVIVAIVFAILTGVFTWLADRESGDTESKKYKGFYAGAVVSGLLFVASLMWAGYSWYASTPLENATEPTKPETETEIAANMGQQAQAIVESAPSANEIVKGALSGENQQTLMQKAKELQAAGEAAAARAEVANKTAQQAAIAATNQSSAAHEKAIQAAMNAAAKKASANQALETLQALSKAEMNSAKLAGNTQRMAAEQQAAALIAKQSGNAKRQQGTQLVKMLPLAAAS